MNAKEELNALNKECGNMNKKLSELSKDELKEVVGDAGHLWDEASAGLITDTEDQSFEMSSGEVTDKFLTGTIDYAK